MKRTSFSVFRCRNRLALAAAFLAILLVCPIKSRATVVNLADGNSSATVDLDSSAGMNNWSVDTQNQLNKQWFWYRIGGGLAMPINTISASSISFQNGNTVVASYANAQITLNIAYVLTGGGPGNSDITESISVINNTGGDLADFNLFQYSDFNLLGTPGGDSVSISGSPGPGFDFVFQSKGLTEIQEAITSPMADRAEAALAFTTLNNLGTIAGYDLDNADSAGPGDVTWAMQWKHHFLEGGDPEFDVFKDKHLSLTPVPEPASMALIALGLGAWGFARRRR